VSKCTLALGFHVTARFAGKAPVTKLQTPIVKQVRSPHASVDGLVARLTEFAVLGS
jgi:hypothetical protein